MKKSLRSALLGAAAIAAGSLFAAPAAACPSDSPYIGTVCYMPTSFCPYGYLKADGSLVAINSYQALYSLIGNLWGGSFQAGNFALPDLRGRVPVGAGAGPGLTPVTRAQVFGAETVTLNTNNVAPHVHPASVSGTSGVTGNVSIAIPVATTPATTNTPGNTVGLTASTVDLSAMGGNTEPVAMYNSDAPTTTLRPFAAPFSTGSLSGVTIGPNTGGTPVAIRNPGVGLTACVAVLGIYPTPD